MDVSFWDRVADRYAARPVMDEEAYEKTLDRVRHWLGPDMRVLEIGCGTGTTALRLAGAAQEIAATDASAEMIRIARSKDSRPGVSFDVKTAEAALAPGYDAVMAFNLLHLVDDLPGLLDHIHAALPAGGLFLSKTPCLGGKPLLRMLVRGAQVFGKAPRLSFITPTMLEAAIRHAGFEIVETGDYPPRFPSRFVVARAV